MTLALSQKKFLEGPNLLFTYGTSFLHCCGLHQENFESTFVVNVEDGHFVEAERTEQLASVEGKKNQIRLFTDKANAT